MEGFFTKKQTAKQRKEPIRRPKSRGKGPSAKKLDCEHCGLFRGVLSPKMDWHGQGGRKILVLGEGPGADEDEQDDQWVGEAGKWLQKSLQRINIDLDADCWRLNSINCRSGEKNPDPTSNQIACCRKMKVLPAIKELKPEFILLMGNAALESFWGDRRTTSDLKIGKFRGRAFPDKETGAWALPLFHPSFVTRGENDENLQALWKRDLDLVSERLEWKPPEFPNPEDQIEVSTDFDRIMGVLQGINDGAERIVFDYETSGLKPFKPGHRVHSIAVVPYFPEDDDRMCLSFPLQFGAPESDEQFWPPSQLSRITNLCIDILQNPKIKKVAHNTKFEDMWTRGIFDVLVGGWEWCTMDNQHIVDNTSGVAGLKWQAWERWGVEGYDEEFKGYLDSAVSEEDKELGKKPSSHSFNRVHEMPLDKLLLYGGYDGILESWLYDEQIEQFKKAPGLNKARKLFHSATSMLCDLQEEGVPIDENYYDTEGLKIREEIEEIGRGLRRTREAKLFYQKEGKPISLTSDHDLRKLFYTHLGKQPYRETAKSGGSVDAESLGKLELDFSDKLLGMKKLNKIASTYFDQIRRESVDGKVYPTTKLESTVTFRPSISSPNLANVPKRDKEAKIRTRKGIRVPPGFKMGQADYASIEVHGLCWYSKDRELLNYLSDPESDMHRDQAQIIFDMPPRIWNFMDKEAVTQLRFFTKNQWNFPEFYGSYWRSCASSLWKWCSELPIGDGKGTKVCQHLDMSFPRFEEKIKEHERVFWRQFKGVREWQDSLSQEYQDNGFTETFFGFRYGGWMSRNQFYNNKVQGTAFHVLLWAMMQLHKMSIERGWKSYVMWQIYDSIIMAIWPPEQEEVLYECNDIMVNQTKKQFPWINTPLKADIEITGVDGTYADLIEFDESRDGYESDVGG